MIDITYCQDDDNPTRIKRKASVSVDSFVGELPSLEGMDAALVYLLISVDPSISTEDPPSSRTTSPSQPTQRP